MVNDVRRTDGEPHNRLTRICAAMTDAMDACPETQPNDKAIVFLDDGRTGGIVLHGYTDQVDALADLMIHLTAIFESNGTKLTFMPMDQIGEG